MSNRHQSDYRASLKARNLVEASVVINKDALAFIDELKKQEGYANRGRAIQLIVEAYKASREDKAA